jgi:hypothetical protein
MLRLLPHGRNWVRCVLVFNSFSPHTALQVIHDSLCRLVRHLMLLQWERKGPPPLGDIVCPGPPCWPIRPLLLVCLAEGLPLGRIEVNFLLRLGLGLCH